MKTVAMIGEGAWGTAVATLLAANNYTVKLWCHDPRVAHSIVKKRINERYLPGIQLSKYIIPVTKLEEAVCDVTWVFEAIPVQYLRSIFTQAKKCFSQEQVWVVLSKGIEKDTLLLPTQIIDEIFGTQTKKAVMAGPSYAQEVAQQEITAASIAADDCELGLQLQRMLANSFFRPYVSTDLIGIQVGSALKNVITLGIGILDGAGYNDNTKAFFLTRGLNEIAQVSKALGGTQETIYGLAGVGDLVLTAMGKLSRNLEVGKRLGRGESLETILQQTGYIPEGINTVQSANALSEKIKLNLFICKQLYAVIFKNKSIEAMLSELMLQPLEWECK